MQEKWIVPINKAKSPRFRVFAFSNGGAGASIYFPWKMLFPDDVELYALQLPGRENRHQENFILEMSLVVSCIADALSKYMDIPFVFFGHSLGALIAFETTRELRRRKTRLPLALFLAGFTSPDLVLRPPIYQLAQKEFIRAVEKYYDPIPEKQLADAKFCQVFLPILQADTQIADTYEYHEESPLDIPIWVFGGNEDPLGQEKNLKGWGQQTTKSFQLKMYPGGHFFIQNARKDVTHIMLDEMNKLL